MESTGQKPENEHRLSHTFSSSDADEHRTLKYHLLGPSLTKAGQDAVDQQKVSEIIYNASKGSKYFTHEESRDRVLTAKIERILKEKARLEKLDLSHDLRRADELISELELTRDLSQHVVHVDCDAFFAAVEELDRPELKTVPMAVGKGVLTTCNYEARKYGCRSGMATFVAKKLCPQLICLPQNFDKYNAKANEIRAIFAQYDPLFESASIDEAYLNMTAFCVENNMSPEEAVQRMRMEVLQNTEISVSAGIAANARLAKIASNRNKPNGQFVVPSNREAIMEFMRNLPVRKVNGIGRVFERELEAIGIVTCGDIYRYRGLLAKVFGQKAFHFLMRCYLGLGRTKIQPVETYERKSIGNEATFHEIGDKAQIREKLWWAAQELENDLAVAQFKGRTLVLKVKLHTFEVLTRQMAPPMAVYLAKDLYNFALPMLSKLEDDIPDMKLRLLGLRCTNLVRTKKVGIEFFGVTPQTKLIDQRVPGGNPESGISVEEAFEQAAREERQEEMDDLERLSQEMSLSARFNDNGNGDAVPAASSSSSTKKPESNPVYWDCPICSRPQPADDRTFNGHVDFCLSRQTIKEAVQGVSHDVLETPTQPRKRKPLSRTSTTSDPRQKRLFFG